MIKNLSAVIAALCAIVVAPSGYANGFTTCSLYENVGATQTSSLENASAGQITAGSAVSLLTDPTTICHKNSDCSTHRSPRLDAEVRGVELGRRESWVCIGVAGKRPLDVLYGWIPITRWLGIASLSLPPSNRWIGVWQNDHAKINIQSADGKNLKIMGHALWTGGALDMQNFGYFDATGIPNHGIIKTNVGNSCQVELRIIDNFLIAVDNKQCGGMNVTFDGVYRFRNR